MDAHLVGYGSSSDEENKKQQIQMNPINKERNFRKREISPEERRNEIPQSKEMDDLGDLSKPQEKAEINSNDESIKLSPPKHNTKQSPENKQKNHGRKSRSRSCSPLVSSDKESKSTTVDEFGRSVRRQHSDKAKDEDRSQEKRRYSRDQKRSRSRSRERDRGGHRHHDRKRDDRYKDHGNRRRYSDRGRDQGRSRDRSPDRSRNRSPDRSRNHSPDRPRNRSPERPRNRSPERTRDRSPERRSTVFLGGTEKKPVVLAKDKAIMSSEEIEKRLAARAESLKHVAQENANNLNLPSYLNPAVVNPQLYAKQQEKRKLLWSSKKTEQAPSNSKMWVGSKFAGDQGGEVQAKFRRLMGIKEGEAGDTVEETTGEKILTDLQNEFERSRAFQLSRGAGGKSGIGLGYGSYN